MASVNRYAYLYYLATFIGGALAGFLAIVHEGQLEQKRRDAPVTEAPKGKGGSSIKVLPSQEDAATERQSVNTINDDVNPPDERPVAPERGEQIKWAEEEKEPSDGVDKVKDID